MVGEHERRAWTSSVRIEPDIDGEVVFKIRIRCELPAPEAIHLSQRREINMLVNSLKDLLKVRGHGSAFGALVVLHPWMTALTSPP